MISNKERILKVLEILIEAGKNKKPISYEEIVNKILDEYDLEKGVGLKGIKDDIATLEDFGYEVLVETNKFGKKFFSIENIMFNSSELRILIDLVSTSRFIIDEDKKEIINKLKTLSNDKDMNNLINSVYMDHRVSFEEKDFIKDLDILHLAIYKNQMVRFRYGRYNLEKEFNYSNDGNFYNSEPLYIVYNSGFYYLVAKNLEKDKIINYRIDRMRDIELVEKEFYKGYFDVSSYVKNCFNMYPGPIKVMKLKLKNGLVNAMIDRFGKDVKMTPYDDEHFILETDAAITPGLVIWILQWGSSAEVLFPLDLKESVKNEIEKMNKIYK